MSPTPTEAAAGSRSRPLTVRPEWIDLNGHLNLAYYHVLFDEAAADELDALGLLREEVATTKRSTFVAESHVVYIRELHEGARVFVTTRIIDFDEKRMHIFQELHHEDGWLAATVEAMVLSIDLNGPNVAPWPPVVFENIRAGAASTAALPRPPGVGRRVGIVRKAPPVA
ncbi:MULTISPECIES: thioesterase family protein [unclassified Aureimonas]|uniref:thioesterase family protein n=1 Tax=unclassified Aureimonas TaxID=2615206 RepID=UPI0006FED710|nr:MULTISPECIES: thioesterase family protein [unclassified Aureimonas]KQT52864.1 hypothetical protein ASG62_13160 [Aureimonas sp. Leaf427]KQT80323.1 hypothetical protein ASG54_07010 [Aureimonas sp. Leaf460]